MKYGVKRYFISFHKRSDINNSYPVNDIYAKTIEEAKRMLRSRFGDVVIEEIYVLKYTQILKGRNDEICSTCGSRAYKGMCEDELCENSKRP